MQVLARERSRVYAAIILLSFLGAAWIAVERLQVEKESNRAGIVIDFYATRQLASEAGRPLADLLRDFRGAGAWGVALEELTVSQAAREGQLMLLDGNEAGPALQAMGLGAVPVSETHTYVVWWPEGTPQWLALSLRLHLEPWARTVAKGRGLVVWEIQARPPTEGFAGVPVSAAAVAHLGLGLSETAVRVIRQAGLAVVPRFLHSPTLTAAQVRARLAQIKAPAYDGIPVVFSGQRVAGYPDLAAEWVSGLAARQLPVGLIEFVAQPGDDAMVRGVGLRGIRVHAITPPELVKMDPEVGVERWRRAVRERDIRLLYVRPLPWENPAVTSLASLDETGGEVTGDLLLQKNVEYLQRIAGALQRDGYELGQPVPFRRLVYPWPILLLLAAGVGAGAWLLLARLVRLPLWVGSGVVAASVVLFAAGYLMGYTSLVRRAFALVAAVAYPTLGVLRARETAGRPGGVMKGYWVATGISLLGALQVVGLLGEVRFMLKIEQFAGVKLAHVAPPFLVFLAVVLGPLPMVLERGAGGWGRVQRFLSAQVPVRYLAAAALAGVCGLLYVLRTGNDALPVWRAELYLRQLLEGLLVVRPRTKELLVGHPLLVAALDQEARGRSSLAGWLMVGAVIGQLSMVNTFSHIHTPLWVSAWRTALGLVGGLIIGWCVARPLVEWVATSYLATRRADVGSREGA
jgi:hypothetical protein